MKQSKRERTKTNKLNLTELWDGIHRSNVHRIIVPEEWEKREQKSVSSNKDNIFQMC